MTIKAIESVLTQTVPDFELIIIDDGSEDGLVECLSEVWRSDDRVSIIRYASNSGLPALRLNAGLLRAKAEIVGYQFEDDYFEPDGLEKLLRHAPVDELFMVYGVSRALTREGSAEWVETSRLGNSAFNFGRLYADNFLANNAVIHSRRLFDVAGMYDPHIVVRRCSDYDLWYRFARVVAPIWCPDVVGAVRVRESNSLGNTVNLTRELYHFYREHNRAEGLSPKNIETYDVLSKSFAGNDEMLQVYLNDVLAPFVAQYLAGDESPRTFGALLNRGPMRLAVAKPDFSTSVDVTIGNFAETFPDAIQFAFFNERHLVRLYDPQFYDLLIQYRTVTSASLEMGARARGLGKAVVYLMDDNMLRISELGKEHEALGPGSVALENTEAQIRGADLVVVYSPQLAEDCYDLTNRVAILSTNTPSKYLRRTPRSPAGKVRFGLVTGAVRLPEIRSMWPQLETFFGRHHDQAELVVWGLDADALPNASLAATIVPFSHSYREYLSRLADGGIDYLICPLDDETATKRSKSPVKLLEATIAGAVLIASDAAPYEVVKRLEGGIVVGKGDHAWEAALETALHQNRSERDGMYGRAVAEVKKNFTTESQFFRFVTVFRSAMLAAQFGRLLGRGSNRIAYIFRETLLGGATLHLITHASLLRDLGYHPVFCVPQAEAIDADFADLASGIGARIERLAYETSISVKAGSILRARELKAFLDRESVGLVHGTPYSGDWILAARSAGLPIVLSLHQPYDRAYSAGLKPEFAPDAVHCSSREYTGVWRKMFRIRCSSMPVPVPASTFALELATSRWPNSTVRVLVSGTLQPRKGQLNAVRAISILIGEGFDVELTLAGYDFIQNAETAGYLPAIREATAEADIAHRVHITGFVRDIDRIYDTTDILLCSSDDESMPHAIIKAMARGIPVVTAPVGGVREVIRDGFSGIVTGSNAPEHLADGIRRVLEMPLAAREEMVRKARRTARFLAAEDVVSANLLGVYLDAFEHLFQTIGSHGAQSVLLRQADVFDVEISGVPGKTVYLLGFDSIGPHQVELTEQPESWETGFNEALGSYFKFNGQGGVAPIKFRVSGENCWARFLRAESSSTVTLRVNGDVHFSDLTKLDGAHEARVPLIAVGRQQEATTISFDREAARLASELVEEREISSQLSTELDRQRAEADKLRGELRGRNEKVKILTEQLVNRNDKVAELTRNLVQKNETVRALKAQKINPPGLDPKGEGEAPRPGADRTARDESSGSAEQFAEDDIIPP